MIEFWQVVDTPDGYGGNLVTEELIAKSWCNIKTASNNRAVSKLDSIGITDVANSIIIHLRHRNDIIYNMVNQFIKYNGYKYVIQNAVNVDLEDIDIEIIATKEHTKDITVIDPINV